jgi:2-keto-4-pentenoate hydratase/2-oxohepta-3-ene-1,7-dioic acid hydratase in catechol pathway
MSDPISILTSNNTINDMRLKINELIYDVNDIVKFSSSNTSLNPGDILISDGIGFYTEPKEYLSDGGNF